MRLEIDDKALAEAAEARAYYATTSPATAENSNLTLRIDHSSCRPRRVWER